jgi:predicted DNA-binding transcriptional regulator YafY
MPKNKSAIIRHRIIDQMINNARNPFPTLEQFAERCSTILGVDVSTSTIEKDLRAMREPAPRGYSAPIVYSKTEKGYAYGEVGYTISDLSLNEEEWQALQFASQLLYQYKNVPIFDSFKNAIERINARFGLGIDGADDLIEEVVSFEKSIDNQGMEWIGLIYEAIKENKGLHFEYQNIYKKEKKEYQLIPYLLKEHRNRWYAIGWSVDKEKMATFALDRISKVDTFENKLVRKKAFNPNEFFSHSIGIMQNNSKPETVLLTIKKPIADLIQLEPLHHTQKTVGVQDNQIDISLNVQLNEEFIFKILGLGTYCIVQKPKSLKNKITSTINEMVANYL